MKKHLYIAALAAVLAFRRQRAQSVEEPQPEPELVSIPILRRRMLYDAGLPNVEEIAALMGLIPLSEDGAEREAEESARRQDAVVCLLPLILEHSAWMAAVLAYMHKDQHDLEDEQVAQLYRTFESLVRSSLLGSLSVMNDLGLVEVKATITEASHVDR